MSEADAKPLLADDAAALAASSTWCCSPRITLYTSHALTKWGQRMWEFAVALLLLAADPQSLFLPALFGFAEAVAVVIFGPAVGEIIDRYHRLTTVRLFIILQNLFIGVSAAGVMILLYSPEAEPYRTYCITVTIVFGALSQVACTGSTVAIEQVWVPLIKTRVGAAQGLANMNAVLRRIDLSCKLLAPVTVGFVIAWSASGGALCIVAWNAVAVFLELGLLERTYRTCSDLLEHGTVAQIVKTDRHDYWYLMTKHVRAFFGGFRTYMKQSVLLPMISLALLYFTVLSFGSLMTAYLQWSGVSEGILGVARGISALFGIISTFAFSGMEARFGLDRTGVIAIWAELVCLFGSVLIGFYAIGPYSTGLQWFGHMAAPGPAPNAAGAGLVPWIALIPFMLGVILARFGLWLFDLAVSQMMQERVPTEVRGIVNGFQNSLQQLFTMGIYAACMVVSRPQDFGWLVWASLGCVSSAALLYSLYECRRDKSQPLLPDGAAAAGSYGAI